MYGAVNLLCEVNSFTFHMKQQKVPRQREATQQSLQKSGPGHKRSQQHEQDSMSKARCAILLLMSDIMAQHTTRSALKQSTHMYDHEPNTAQPMYQIWPDLLVPMAGWTVPS